MQRLSLAVLAAFVALPPPPSQAQPTEAAAPAETAAPDKALRYHKALLGRPAPGYLFDRFFDAWVDEASVESLGDFLKSRADESPADGLLAAFFYAKQGDDLQALEQFRETLAAAPGSADAWYQKALIEARSLNFENALSDLAKAADAAADDETASRISKLRGRLLVRSGRREEAITELCGLVERRPDDEQLAEDVVELLVDEGLYDDAAGLAERLVARTDDAYRKVLRRLRLGDIRQQSGDRAAAVTIYSDVLEEVGADTWLEREVLAQVERAFRREEDTGGLKKHYEKLVERYPQRVAVLRGHARVLADSGDSKGAIERFRAILAVTPGDRENQQEFVQLHLRLGDFAGAREQLERLVELHPDDAELRVELAEVAAKLKDEGAVVAAVDKYLELSDKSEYAHLRAARLLERLELPDQARAKYALLTEAFPESRSAKESRAAFLYKSGDKPSAIDLWRAAAEGGDSLQYVRVAKALAARQEHQAAYELLQSQAENLADDPLYLAQTIDTALAVDKPDEAVPLARRRVRLADDPAELQDAIAQAARVIDRAEATVRVLGELESAERLLPQQVCLKAELHDRAGDPQRADDTLRPLVEGGDLMAVSQQVRLARSRRDWDAAADAAERLLDLPDGRNSRNLRQLIELLERAYRVEEALARAPEWKRLSPGSSGPWLTEARLVEAQGKQSEAIEILRRAARQLDDARDVRSRLAQLYTEAGQLADAERIYWRDYEESEDVVEKVRAVEQIARVAEQQGKAAALVDDFQERRRANRDSIEPLLALAAIHRVTGDYAKRVQALGEAAKLRPDDMQLLAQIAREQEREGDWEAARDTLRRAAEADPTQRSKQNLARLLIRWGETDQGYALLREMVTDTTDDPRELEKVADAMAGAGDWRYAIDFLRPLVDRYPDDYRLRYLLGVALEEDDQLDAAADAFLAVLRCDEQAGAGPANAATNWYQGELHSIAPPGLSDLINATQRTYQAYTHLQNRGGMVAYQGSGLNVRSTVSMPSDADTAHGYALAHLSQIGSLLEDEKAAAIREAAAATGVADAEAALALGGTNSPTGARQVDFEALGDLVDRPAVMAYLVLTGADAASVPPEYYLKAVTALSEGYPQVALIAALHGIKRSDLPVDAEHPLVRRAIELIGRIDEPATVTLMQACQWRNQSHTAVAAQAPEALREELGKWVVEGYRRASTPQNYGAYLFLQIAGMLRENGDPATYVSFIEQEAKKHDASSKASAPIPFIRQQEALVAPPAFPPASLRSVPGSVLALLQMTSRQPNVSVHIGGVEREATWSDEAFAEAVASVDDDTLRVLLAASIEDSQEIIDRTIADLLDAAKPSLDAYLLGAGWSVKNEEPTEAISLLSKARFLPMNADERRSIDGSLVALVQRLTQGDEPPSEDLLQLGRDAALRLRHGKLDPNARAELATAMAELGLEKEADRLEKIGGSAATRVVSQVARPQPAASRDQIQRMIEAGRTDSAVRRLAQELRGAMQQIAQNPWNRGHYARQLREKFEGYALIDETLAELDPGDSAAHRKHAEYAEALLVFDKHDRAVEALRRAAELRPRDDGYRVSLMLALVAAGRPDEAEELAGGLGRDGAALLAAEVASKFHDYEHPIDQRLAQIALAVAAFEHSLDTPRVDVSWAPRFRQAVANPHHTRQHDDRLELLYSKDADQDTEPRKRRRTLHDRFCRAMLRQDQTACDGLAGLWAAAEANEGVHDDHRLELLDWGADALRRHEPIRVTSQAFNRVPMSASNQPGAVRLRSPAELLVRHAAEADEWSTVDKLQSDLDSGGDPAARRAVRELRELYQCSEEEFLDRAESLVRSWRGRNAAPPGGEVSPEMAVLDCYRLRGLGVDIEPLFDRVLTQAGRQSGSLPDALIDYAAYLAEAEGSTAAADWLEKIAATVICPRDRREAYVAKHYSQGGWSSNSPNGQIHLFGQLLNQAAQQPDLALPVAKFLANGRVGTVGSNAAQVAQSRIRIEQPSDPETVERFLEDAGLLAAAGELPLGPLASSSLGGGKSLADLCFGALGSVPAETRQAVAERLAERQPQTLGLWLAQVALRPKKGEAPSLEFLAGHLGELKQLEPEQRAQVASRLSEVVTSLANESSDEGPGVADAVAWIEAESGRSSKAVVERLEGMSRFEELGVEGHQLDEWLAQNLPALVEDDLDTAAWAYLEVCRLYDDAMARGVSGMYFSGSTAAYMLPRLSYYWRRNGDSTGLAELAIAVLDREADEGVVLGRNDLRQVLEPIKRKWDELRASANGAQQRLEAWKTYLAWLEEEIASADSPALLPLLYDRLDRLNQEDVEAIAEWLDEQRGEAAAPDLVANAAAAARWALDRLRSGENRYDYSRLSGREAAAAHHRYVAERLADADTPLGVRATLAVNLAALDGRRTPAETARAIALCGAEACDATFAFDYEVELTLARNAYELTMDGDDDPAAARYLDAWEKRYVTTRPRTNQRGYPRSPNEAQSRDAVLCLVAAMCQRGEPERVLRIVKRYDRLLEGRHEVVALLTRHDQIDDAARFARAGWNEYPLTNSSSAPVVYDARLEQQAEKLYAALEGPVGYVAEVALSRLPDPDQHSDAQPPSVAREERMIRLAQRFDQAALETTPMKNAALVLFHDTPQASDLLGDHLAEAADPIRLAPFGQSGGDRLQKAGKLKQQHAEWALRDGDAGPAIALLDELTSPSRNNNWALWNLYHQVGGDLWRGMLESVNQHDRKQLREIADCSRRLFERMDNGQPNQVNRLVTLAAQSHAFVDAADEYIAWLGALGEQGKRVLRDRGLESSGADRFLGNLDRDDPESCGARAERLAQVVRIGVASGWLRPAERGWPSVVSQQGRQDFKPWDVFFTPEEVPDAAASVAEKAGEANAFVWQSAACQLDSIGKHQEAAHAWREAIAATDSGGEGSRMHLRTRLIDSLISAELFDAARDEVASWSSTTGEENAGEPSPRHEGLLKRIDQAEQKANPEAGDTTKPDAAAPTAPDSGTTPPEDSGESQPPAAEQKAA
ncbi:tetratricopeptide repeat protein [Botrimarina sp.]|uniref:tetratricopeptide repeat protein n=1 Tax=Botrimarina sp. TaxID=2795802 RepID=UPI0032EC9AE1